VFTFHALLALACELWRIPRPSKSGPFHLAPASASLTSPADFPVPPVTTTFDLGAAGPLLPMIDLFNRPWPSAFGLSLGAFHNVIKKRSVFLPVLRSLCPSKPRLLTFKATLPQCSLPL